MIDCLPEPTGRVLELKEVHSFSEYHDSLEQDHGKIAKSYADFTIRHYGSSSTVVFDGHEEDMRVREDDVYAIHPAFSFTDETDLSYKREGLLSRATDPNERYVMNWEKENVTWITNMSGGAYVDIVNIASETSLQHMTTLTVSPCLLIYFAHAE